MVGNYLLWRALKDTTRLQNSEFSRNPSSDCTFPYSHTIKGAACLAEASRSGKRRPGQLPEPLRSPGETGLFCSCSAALSGRGARLLAVGWALADCTKDHFIGGLLKGNRTGHFHEDGHSFCFPTKPVMSI